MATIFLVNIKVGDNGRVPGLLMKLLYLLLQLGAKCGLTGPSLASYLNTQVLFLGREFSTNSSQLEIQFTSLLIP